MRADTYASLERTARAMVQDRWLEALTLYFYCQSGSANRPDLRKCKSGILPSEDMLDHARRSVPRIRGERENRPALAA